MPPRKPSRGPARLDVRVKVLPHGEGLPLPEPQSPGAAGLDLVAALSPDAPLVLTPGARALVPTGLQLELPQGTEAQIRPRSGLALKHGLTVLNSPGTIDSDYRGEVQVLLINLGTDPVAIRRGERIAQMVVAAHTQVWLLPAADLSGTERGSGGFGSTGREILVAKSALSKAGSKNRKPLPGTRRNSTGRSKAPRRG